MNIFKRIIFFILILFPLFSIVAIPYKSYATIKDCFDINFSEYFSRLFGENVSQKAYKNDSVYVSGTPLGFTVYGDGVIIVGIGEVESECGKVFPCEGHGIKEGDLLIEINGERIDNAKTIENIIENQTDIDKTFELVFLRDKKRIIQHILPAVDIRTGKRRFGLWVRDNTAGIGTLTYITKNYRFGALGHPVCDADTGAFLPVLDGDMFECNVVGVDKGIKGSAGELKGIFVKTAEPVGKVYKNNDFGIYGEIFEDKLSNLYLREVPVAKRDEIYPGKAVVLSTVSGTVPQEFEVEIIKTSNQSSSKSKSMVIRITDPMLLDKTGGIVQGMSGSPILQNGKFVGAITHVFVSDPTKGFGVYAEWMLQQ